MRSAILSAAMKFVFPLILLVSIFLLLRGHHQAGGGFVGGLVAAAGFVLLVMANGITETRRLLRVRPRVLIALGVLTACCSGLLSLMLGKPFLTGLWTAADSSPLGSLGTPLLFDTGVYLVVLGVVTLLVSTLAEE